MSKSATDKHSLSGIPVCWDLNFAKSCATRRDRKNAASFHIPQWCVHLVMLLEAQQRYFSYRGILVVIVLQDSFVLVFFGYRIIIARYVAKRGIA